MFVKLKTVKDRQYLSIAESYWDRDLGKSRQRVVASLGCLDHLKPAQLIAIGNKFIELAGETPPSSGYDLAKL